jgi:hypothetical protein
MFVVGIAFIGVALLGPSVMAGDVVSVQEDKPPAGVQPSGSQPESTGGPDPFGYTFIDSDEAGGPTFNWTDISATGTDMVLDDDSYFFPITLPFSFNFYGTDYTDIAVGSNGVIYFTDAYLGLGNVCLPGDPGYSGIVTFIAVYWDDLNPSAGGQVYYEIIGSAPDRRLIVQWNAVPHFSYPDPITVQAVLFEGSDNILLQFQDPSAIAGSEATVGIQADAATNALEYSCNTAALNAGLAVCFAHPNGGDSNCSSPIPVELSSFDVE